MDYKIPEEIISKIPQHFWPAFAGELVGVFGPTIFDKSEEDTYLLFFHSSTNGWNAALRTTCKKLDLGWLYDYYDTLDWWESDQFDGEFEDLVISKFVEPDERPLAYYSWLVGDENEERMLRKM